MTAYRCTRCGLWAPTRICSTCQRQWVPPEKQVSSMVQSHAPVEDEYGDESDADSVAHDAETGLVPKNSFDGSKRHNGRIMR